MPLNKMMRRKIKNIVNRRFNASSIIPKTEVINPSIKVVIYWLSLKWTAFQYAWIM